MMSSAIAVIILAAGSSSRLGIPKQLLPCRETNLLCHSVNIALKSDCRPVIVVLGAYFEQIYPEIVPLPVYIVKNENWEQGMGTSIQKGIQALIQIEPNIEAVIITLCDQPFLSLAVISQLLEAYRTMHQPIIASEYADTVGVPALFERLVFPDLMNLKGREGAKQVIKKYEQSVFRISFPGGEIDLDTPQDYEKWRSELS
jgi:molybdenum cofactor cytidylyltransferase